MANRIAHDGLTKFCGACEEDRSIDDFALRSDRGGGRQSVCKDCRKEFQQKWYAEHKDEQIQRSRDNYDSELAQIYREANKSRELAYAAEYRVAHPGHVAQWEREHPERVRQGKRIRNSTRRARKKDQFIEQVDPRIVYQMHGGMCGICKEFVSEDDFHVDHVIPLAKGGMHGYVNVQPAHPKCNLSKGASI